MLELRLNSESTASLPSPHPPPLPASVPPQWKRGASSNHSVNVRAAVHPLTHFCNPPSAQVSPIILTLSPPAQVPPPKPPWAQELALRNGRR